MDSCNIRFFTSFFGGGWGVFQFHFEVVSDEPSTSDGVHEVELLLSFMKDTCAEGVLALFPLFFFFLLFKC